MNGGKIPSSQDDHYLSGSLWCLKAGSASLMTRLVVFCWAVRGGLPCVREVALVHLFAPMPPCSVPFMAFCSCILGFVAICPLMLQEYKLFRVFTTKHCLN